jgi:SAM-dependent methyltransferase
MGGPPDPRSGWGRSFGADAERYERTRPRYPEALLRRIIDGCPGRELLDVGCGTGIVARQLQAAGATVRGVEVDERMAQIARGGGIEVETAAFERWDPRGRAFDGVLAGQVWHWIDPDAGAVAAARALRPAGRLAVFWNIGAPTSPELMRAFSAVYEPLPGPLARAWAVPPLQAYETVFGRTTDGVARCGAFGDLERWTTDWTWTYSRDDWLQQIPTFGGHDRLGDDRLNQLVAGIGAAIDAAGGSFEMAYTTVALTAARRSIDA